MSDRKPRPGTLDFAARTWPRQVALVDGAERRTWDAWDERACRLASALRARLALRAGDRVAWMLPNGVAYYDLAFAAAKLGVGLVSVPHRLTGSEAAFIVADSGAVAVFADQDAAGRLAQARRELPLPDARFVLCGDGSEAPAALAGATELEALIREGDPTRFCFAGEGRPAGPMVYTSGTTGRPKGAARDLSGRDPGALREYQAGMTKAFGFAPGQGDVHLLCCPLYHSAPPTFANLALVLGGRVLIMRKFDAERALRLIEEARVTSTFMVPTMLRRITSLPEEVRARYDLSSMRRLLTGGAPCPLDLKRAVMGMFPQPCLYEFYGSTETAVVTVMGPDEHERKPGSCGRLVPGCEAKVLDEQGRELPPGEAGLLFVRNPMVTDGYHNDRAASDAARREGFFAVGDVARFDEDGFCFLVDRKSDMIISGGVNIYPAEVEAALRAHPAVYDCAVFGVPNEEWGEEVKAVVQLADGARTSEAELLAFVGERVAGFKRPRSVDFVAHLPYSPTGKLLKRELRRPYWEAAGRAL